MLVNDWKQSFLSTIFYSFPDSPLDLSVPLLSTNPISSQPNTIPSISPLFIEDRISVSSDSGLSSSEESISTADLFKRTPPSPPITPKSPTTPLATSSTTSTSLTSPNANAGKKARASHKKMLPCSFCGKCFDRPSLLNRHLRTHTGERPHVCDICEKGFSTSSSLNTHRRIHSGEKPHECTICGKRFTASSNLYYHRMTHVKVSCGQTFCFIEKVYGLVVVQFWHIQQIDSTEKKNFFC